MNRNKTKCYWESQPTGCKKPHCPFLHDKPKEPYPEAVTKILESPATSTQTIIVNKNKIAELSGLILPVRPGLNTATVRARVPEGSAVTGRKVLVPQRSPSVKARLGPRRVAAKDRLGERAGESHDRIEVFECSEEEDDDALNSEEEALRSSAMKTLDLRNRLTSRRVREVDSGDELLSEDSAGVMEPAPAEKVETVLVKKKVKKEKKERKVKDKKAAKKAKKVEKRIKRGKKTSMDIGARALLSIKADAEREVKSKRVVEKEGNGEEEVKSIIKGKKNLENIKVRLDIRAEDSPSPSPPPPRSRTRKRRAADVAEEAATKGTKKSTKAKKRKTSEKASRTEKKHKKKEEFETEVDEIERLLNEDGEGTKAATTVEASKPNDTSDVIKEMDDLLNDE